jgi:hypothetical protein
MNELEDKLLTYLYIIVFTKLLREAIEALPCIFYVKDARYKPAFFESLNCVSHRSIRQVCLLFDIAQSHCSVVLKRLKDQFHTWGILSEPLCEGLVVRNCFSNHTVHGIHQIN